MAERTLAVYDAVARSMPAGAQPGALVLTLAGIVPRTQVHSAIANLRHGGYLRHEARGAGRVYFTTSKVPSDYTGTAAAAHAGLDTGDDDATDHLFSKRQPPRGRPEGVPNSVFQLGDMQAAAAGSQQAPAATPEPAPAPQADKVQAGGYLAWQGPPLGHRAVAAPAAAAMPEVPRFIPPATPRPPVAPRFALGSDDSLDISDGELQVRLSPGTTRALFVWLDRLGRAYVNAVLEAA